MSVNKSIKEKLFNQLNTCLIALGSYDINSLMPLIYVIVAHHQGHMLSIIGAGNSDNIFAGNRRIQSVEDVDGYESDLLKEIRQSVSPNYFEGKSAEVVFRFYDICNEYINDNYREIIEYIISFYSSRGGRYAGIGITPTEIAKLMAKLIEGFNPSIIYDPCVGLASFSLQDTIKDIPLVGQEINSFVKVLADVRLDAWKKKATIFNEDSSENWRDEDGCDVLASELPFGTKLYNFNLPVYIEDFIISEFIHTPSLRKAVLLVSMTTCNRRDNLYIRKTLCENNWLDYVIKLPIGIMPYSGISTTIIVLNKERKTKDIKFVLADDCILNEGKSKILDFQSVIDRIIGKDDKQSVFTSVETTFDNNFSLDPSIYVQSKIDVLPGQKIVKFTSLATKEKGIRKFEETNGRVLKQENMCESIAEMHTRDISIAEEELKQSYIKICSKVLIFNVRADRFFIKYDDDVLFVSPNYSCFTVNEDKCIPEYLADCVVKAKQFRASALKGEGMPRIDWNNMLLPIYENLESQKQIVHRIYREERNELKKKLESLQVLSGKSSDLIHNLGITFTKISAGIGKLLNDGSNEILEGLNDNVQFALRQINSTGTDFGFVYPEMEKVNVLDILSNYVRAWKNFGYKTFEILPIKKEVSEDTKVEIDITLFYTMLDCILINAHQHGFHKQENQDNKVLIEVAGVTYKEEKYIRIGISNNGNPMPDNFSIKDFVARGVVGINSSQDGIGGDHIHKISNHFGGLVSIDSDSEWVTINILLPVYLTSNYTKFKDYECECL